MEKKFKEQYTPPIAAVVEIETLQMLAMSGYGDDTEGNYVFAKERRGEWGNLWNK